MDLAARDYQQALAINPVDPSACYGQGLVLANRGEISHALMILRQAVTNYRSQNDLAGVQMATDAIEQLSGGGSFDRRVGSCDVDQWLFIC